MFLHLPSIWMRVLVRREGVTRAWTTLYERTQMSTRCQIPNKQWRSIARIRLPFTACAPQVSSKSLLRKYAQGTWNTGCLNLWERGSILTGREIFSKEIFPDKKKLTRILGTFEHQWIHNIALLVETFAISWIFGRSGTFLPTKSNFGQSRWRKFNPRKFLPAKFCTNKDIFFIAIIFWNFKTWRCKKINRASAWKFVHVKISTNIAKKWNEAVKFFQENKLNLNIDKSCFLIINPTTADKRTCLILDSGVLKYKSQFDYLGVIVSDTGSLKDDVKSFISRKSGNVTVKFTNFCKTNKNAPLHVKLDVLDKCAKAHPPTKDSLFLIFSLFHIIPRSSGIIKKEEKRGMCWNFNEGSDKADKQNTLPSFVWITLTQDPCNIIIIKLDDLLHSIM